jgi:hypothetical protein
MIQDEKQFLQRAKEQTKFVTQKIASSTRAQQTLLRAKPVRLMPHVGQVRAFLPSFRRTSMCALLLVAGSHTYNWLS